MKRFTQKFIEWRIFKGLLNLNEMPSFFEDKKEHLK